MRRLDRELLIKNIEAVANEDLEQNNVFGSAYFVSQDGEVLFDRCFGVSSLEKGTPVTDRTIFRLASMTKPITSVAVLTLVRDGLLSLSDPVSKYLPEFSELNITKVVDGGLESLGRAKNTILVSDLLSHTSGFGCSMEKHAMMKPEDKTTPRATVDFFLRAGLDFEPRTAQSYSPLAAFDVAVLICEKLTGRDHLEYLKSEIFEPCGMTDTTYIPTPEQWGRVIDMHGKKDGQSIVLSTEKDCSFGEYPCTHYLGGGGLVSTLYDYSLFARMLLNGGMGINARVLPEELVKTMGTPIVPTEIMNGRERWGLGVRVIVSEEYRYLAVGTFGWSGAYGTHYWVDPENRIAAVFMKNSGHDGGAGNRSARHFEKAVNASFAE